MHSNSRLFPRTPSYYPAYLPNAMDASWTGQLGHALAAQPPLGCPASLRDGAGAAAVLVALQPVPRGPALESAGMPPDGGAMMQCHCYYGLPPTSAISYLCKFRKIPQTIRKISGEKKKTQTFRKMPQTIRKNPQQIRKFPQTIRKIPQTIRKNPQTIHKIPQKQL